MKTVVMPKIETRSMPQEVEKRNTLLEELENIIETAKTEKRSLSSKENSRFSVVKSEIDAIDLKLAEDSVKAIASGKFETRMKSRDEIKEERAFLDYVVKGDMRALSASGSGGAVIPTTIAQQVVDRIVQQSPLLQNATFFNTNSDLVVPVFDFTQITSGYITENTPLADTGAEFASVRLSNFIVAALIRLSRSLVNRSDIDVVNYLVGAMAKNLGYFLERELILGTGTTRLRGLATLPAEQQFVGATTLDITGDELIDLQLRLPQLYQENAVWVMNPSTLSGIRKLKSAQGEYLFSVGQFGSDMGMTLLGKPVYLSDAVPVNAPDALAVYYLDPACLYIKMTEQIGVQVLDQTFANSYQYGILGYVECDSAIAEIQGVVAYRGA